MSFELPGANLQSDSPSTHGDRRISSEKEKRQQGALYHILLPILEATGFIDWQEEAGEVTKGPAFEDLEPLLRFLPDSRDGLSGITVSSEMAGRGEEHGIAC